MLNCSMKSYWVYILASRPRGTLYVGMTNDLVRRVYEHREGLAGGFTKEHCVKTLVYYERHARQLLQFSARRTSNIGRANGRWISFSRKIRIGAINGTR
jgi:putative endonuclease